MTKNFQFFVGVMLKKYSKLSLFLIVFLFLIQPASANFTNVSFEIDTYVGETSPTSNYSGYPNLWWDYYLDHQQMKIIFS